MPPFARELRISAAIAFVSGVASERAIASATIRHFTPLGAAIALPMDGAVSSGAPLTLASTTLHRAASCDGAVPMPLSPNAL